MRLISRTRIQFGARVRAVAVRLWHGMPWYAPRDSLQGRNLRNLFGQTAWFGVLDGLAATFVSVFALRLGATTGQIGWLTALPALVNVVWLIPAARIIERQRRRLPLIILGGLLQRVGYLSMAAMPFLVVAGRVEALIILNTLIVLPTAVINTAITSLIPDLTSAEDRGRVISVRWLLLSAVATVAALAGGKLLELMPVPVNYQVLLGVGSAVSLVGVYYLRRIQMPDAVLARRAIQPRQRYSWARLRQSLVTVMAHRAFVRFAAAAFVYYWGLYLPAALWSVLRVRDLGASDTWIGVIALVVNASTIVGYLAWSRLGAKRGDRWLLIVTALGVTAYALTTALVPSIAWMIPTSILGGLSWSGCNLALFNVLLTVCPSEHRPTYIATFTALVNISAFAAPLLGAAFSDWLGIRIAFVIASVVRLVGTLLFVRLVHE